MKMSDDIRTIFSLIFADVVYTGTAATQTKQAHNQFAYHKIFFTQNQTQSNILVLNIQFYLLDSLFRYSQIQNIEAIISCHPQTFKGINVQRLDIIQTKNCLLLITCMSVALIGLR